MTGNYIDFGAMSSVDNAKLEELLAESEKNGWMRKSMPG